jgi:hypothetical protein
MRLHRSEPGDTEKKDAGSAPLQWQYVQKVIPGIQTMLPSFPSHFAAGHWPLQWWWTGARMLDEMYIIAADSDW